MYIFKKCADKTMSTMKRIKVVVVRQVYHQGETYSGFISRAFKKFLSTPPNQTLGDFLSL